MKKQHVQLTATDQDYLETLISKGELKARSYRRALGLLELDRGKTYTDVAKTLRVAVPTLSCWAAQYRFCQALAAEYPQATKIRLVQDN